MKGQPKKTITPMRVLFYSSYVSHESGASHAMRETVRRLVAQGVKAVVVVPDCEGSREMFPRSEFDAVYLRIERPRQTRNAILHLRFFLSVLPTWLALRKIIRQREIDVVHFNEITDFLGGLAGRSCDKPCVCHVRADGISYLYRRLLIPLLNRIADVVVVPSKSTEVWIRAEHSSLARKIRLIHDYAFNIAEYDRPVSGAAFREECGISAGDVLVVLVSKLVAHKGHECFILSAEKVLSRSKGVRFAIVGGEVSGHDEEASRIRRLAEELTPAPGLRLVGHQINLPTVYAACDIAVHCPVFPDTYPTVVLLAMAAGRPIIGSATGGIPEQIDDARTGVLVPPNDPEELAQAILELAKDPERRRLLGAAAKIKIQNEFAPDTQVRLLMDVYSHVLHHGRVNQSDSQEFVETL